MDANDLPDEIPEHLRTDANATLLHQVALDAVREGVCITEKNMARLMQERLARNERILESPATAEAVYEILQED